MTLVRASPPVEVEIRNTFITINDKDDEDDSLFRTASDPLGGSSLKGFRSNRYMVPLRPLTLATQHEAEIDQSEPLNLCTPDEDADESDNLVMPCLQAPLLVSENPDEEGETTAEGATEGRRRRPRAGRGHRRSDQAGLKATAARSLGLISISADETSHAMAVPTGQTPEQLAAVAALAMDGLFVPPPGYPPYLVPHMMPPAMVGPSLGLGLGPIIPGMIPVPSMVMPGAVPSVAVTIPLSVPLVQSCMQVPGFRPKDEATHQLPDLKCEQVSHEKNVAGPAFGNLHTFHLETGKMGLLSADKRSFTKQEFKGRLSVVTESEIHTQGTMRYAVQFSSGELSSADGIGFIFSARLPCPKNIQKIVSIFANRTGRLCVRANAEVIRSDISVRPLELGDWLEMTVNLEAQLAHFTVWPRDGGMPSCASLAFGDMLDALKSRIPTLPKVTCGYMAIVVKHIGVSVVIGS